MYDTVKLVQSQGYEDFNEDARLQWIFGDNQSALQLANSTVTSKKSKHLQLRLHHLRDHKDKLCYVPTDLNRQDGFTKCVPARVLWQIYGGRGVEAAPVEDVDGAIEDFDDGLSYLVWINS